MNLKRASIVLGLLAAGMILGLVLLERRDRALKESGGDRLPPPLSWLSTPAPQAPFELRVQGTFSLEPLDLREVGLVAEGDRELVGVVGSQKVTTKEVDERGVGALRRITESQVEAQKRAITWLAEHEALAFEAKRAGQPLTEILLAAYQALPPPTEAELENLRASEGKADPETMSAVRSQWRILRWKAKRSQIVKVGSRNQDITMVTTPASMPAGFTPEKDVAAVIGAREVTRDEVRRLAGLSELRAQSEYFQTVRRAFDSLISVLAVEAEAKRLDLTPAKLYEKAHKEYPPVTEQQITDYLAKHPGYQTMKNPRKIVRTNLELGRSYNSRVELEAKLSKGKASEFRLKEPPVWPMALPSLNPVVAGAKGAKVTAVVLHAFGSGVGQEFGAEIEELVGEYGDKVRFEILPHYPTAEALIPYRAAHSLHCAQEQGRTIEYFRDLRRTFPYASIENLTVKARNLGLDEAKFRQCMADDRYLPFLYENRLLAERIGLDDGEPAMFIDGKFVEGFRDRVKAKAALDKALGIVRPAAGSQPVAVAPTGRDAAAARAPDAAPVAVARPQRDAGATKDGQVASSVGVTPGVPASDAIAADLRTMKDKVEGDLADARRALRQPKPGPQATDQERAAAMATMAEVSRKVSTSFASYKAMTPEVKALSREASAAWKDYSEAAERLAAAARAKPPDPARGKAALEAMGMAYKRVQEAMGKISRAFKERGV